VNLVNCLNFMGHRVKLRPYSADFGFSYKCNIGIWEMKSTKCNRKRKQEIAHGIPQMSIKTLNSVCESGYCQDYLCRPYLFGLSKKDCILYSSTARKPNMIKVDHENVQLNYMNSTYINATHGPTVVHDGKRFYWQRLRNHVKQKSIFWYWFGLMCEKNCSLNGKFYKVDLKEFQPDDKIICVLKDTQE
jgi:hypothetical protein